VAGYRYAVPRSQTVARDPDKPQLEAPPAPVAGNGERAVDESHPDMADGPVVLERPSPWRSRLIKLASVAGALFLFVLAIQLMKNGAGAIAPRLRASGLFDNGVQTLGVGWLGAYLVLSGSPVAVLALSLRSAHGLTELQTFTMISGSRLGASFIVLLVGFIYAIRRRNREESLGMGVLALSISTALYIPGMLLGYGILKSGILAGINWTSSGDVQGVIDVGWGWVVDAATGVLPPPLLLPLGLGVILVSFKLLDGVLPTIDSERQADTRGHWLRKPWPMFLLGCLACLLTLSVSVAITVLVPLAARGYVDRKDAIPYIAGANITTLADTLLAAMLLPDGSSSVQVVLALAISVTILTLLILAFAYRPLQRGIMALDEWVVHTNRRLWLFVGILFLAPVALLIMGGLIGPVG
jgi:solute carrier family 34 (sodium-dependent phosphate cotransporter)